MLKIKCFHHAAQQSLTGQDAQLRVEVRGIIGRAIHNHRIF